MDIIKIKLEDEAFSLICRIDDLYQSERIKSSKNIFHFKLDKLKHVLDRSHLRYERRQAKLFNYYPGGFAPSPALSSGVVGQGTL
jgi:hypothetical protein